jgi:hypothetical protein
MHFMLVTKSGKNKLGIWRVFFKLKQHHIQVEEFAQEG